jgi:peptidoglycan/xylan/chitin deacetylase (PgdA/CDA1 family)
VRAIALGYHDIVAPGSPDASGFPGPTAARYKLSPDEFTSHLDAVAALHPEVIPDVRSLRDGPGGRLPVILTFDDGGTGALAAAECLDRRGWKGHFFVTAGRIGTQGFLDAEGVRSLHRRGHVIGSHSRTHPERMSVLLPEEQRREWTESITLLTDIIGETVDVASVPGGYFTPGVARAAAGAGVRTLFTSEPTARLYTLDGCLVVGRYSVVHGMPAGEVAAIASGGVGPRLRQALLWNGKKAAKVIGGKSYLTLRRFIIARRTRP